MKLYLDDAEYDIEEALSACTLGDLMKLKVKTKTSGFLGITVKSIRAGFMRVGKEIEAIEKAGGEFDPLDLLADIEFLQSLQGLIYLSKRNAGEKLEPDEAADVQFRSIRIDDEDDEDEEAGEADPKAPPVSDPDGSAATP